MGMATAIPITATTGPIHITAPRIVRTHIARTTGITAEEFITHVTVTGVKPARLFFVSWWASARQLACFLDQERRVTAAVLTILRPARWMHSGQAIETHV